MTTAKLFMNGRSQAVRLPREFRFEGEDEVLISRLGDLVLLVPKSKWKKVFREAVEGFPDDVDWIRNNPRPDPKTSP